MNIFTVLKVLLLLGGISLAFDPESNQNVAVYWGQNTVAEYPSLGSYCESSDADIFIISFLLDFPDPMNLNLAGYCGSTFSDGLLHCPQVGEDIVTCQSLGKKVFLSLGGSTGNYGFTSDTEAASFAQTLWDTFGEGTGTTERPFDSAIIDGFDFDIEQGTDIGYDTLATTLRSLFTSGSKDYYISAAPQCPSPDAHLDKLLSNSLVDFVFIQFYNNYCDADATFNWDQWVDYAENTSKNLGVKLFIGLPASTSSANSGYLELESLQKTIDTVSSSGYFGGVSLWDVEDGTANIIDGKNYVSYVKCFLTEGDTCLATTTTTTSSTSMTSTTSTTSITSTSSTSTTITTETTTDFTSWTGSVTSTYSTTTVTWFNGGNLQQQVIYYVETPATTSAASTTSTTSTTSSTSANSETSNIVTETTTEFTSWTGSVTLTYSTTTVTWFNGGNLQPQVIYYVETPEAFGYDNKSSTEILTQSSTSSFLFTSSAESSGTYTSNSTSSPGNSATDTGSHSLSKTAKSQVTTDYATTCSECSTNETGSFSIVNTTNTQVTTDYTTTCPESASTGVESYSVVDTTKTQVTTDYTTTCPGGTVSVTSTSSAITTAQSKWVPQNTTTYTDSTEVKTTETTQSSPKSSTICVTCSSIGLSSSNSFSYVPSSVQTKRTLQPSSQISSKNIIPYSSALLAQTGKPANEAATTVTFSQPTASASPESTLLFMTYPAAAQKPYINKIPLYVAALFLAFF